MHVTISPVTQDQLEAAYELVSTLREGLQRDEFDRIYQQAKTADDYQFTGAFINDQLVGLIGFRTLYDFLHKKHIYVDDLMVSPSHRSHGIGSKLLAYIEAHAAETGCNGIRLSTGLGNTRGINFYEREKWFMQSCTFKKGFGISQ